MPNEGGQALLNTLNKYSNIITYKITINITSYEDINITSDKILISKDIDIIFNSKSL